MTVIIPRSKRSFGELNKPIIILTIMLGLLVLGIVTFTRIQISLLPSILVYIVLMLGFGICLRLQEKRRSLKDLLVSVGFRKQGIGKSILWTMACIIPYIVVIFLISGKSLIQQATSLKSVIPTWLIICNIIYFLVLVAAFEESFFRGYLLDRFMPEHPSSIKKALPAILLSSLFFMIYHTPILVFNGNLFSLAPILVISLLLCLGYVRSRNRNIIGPVIAHFLIDSSVYFLALFI
jgi:membrane protease YdiL (CAAX protease family)